MTAQLAQSMTPSSQQWLLLGGLAIVAGLFFFIKRREKAFDGSPKQYRREIDSANRETADIRNDLEKLLGELERLSTKITAQLDEKYGVLQDAVKDADQRIFAMRTLVQAANSMLGPVTPAPERLPSAQDLRTQRIHELSDQGLGVHEVARRLEEPVGEVELILNLRRSNPKIALPAELEPQE
jgi:LPXTG-motif cell wall-anchored protein